MSDSQPNGIYGNLNLFLHCTNHPFWGAKDDVESSLSTLAIVNDEIVNCYNLSRQVNKTVLVFKL